MHRQILSWPRPLSAYRVESMSQKARPQGSR
uniref:Uncharacterized protein n=1 Tax=Anguilla anguilla TaxID=7936 RepID=A0A0E9QZQ3_ANGAN